MVPGKKYKPEDFLWMAWRRRWFILVPLVLVSAGTAIWAYSLPSRYKSQTVVFVSPPQIPSGLVRDVDNTPLSVRLQTLQRRLLSRTQLERIIQEFDLYPEIRRTGFMEQAVSKLDKDIGITVSKPQGRRTQPDSFAVSYVSEQPRLAMQVADRLASLFVNAHIESRELQAGNTTQFIESQLEETKRRLEAQQLKVEDYKRTHNGALPTQLQSTLQALNSTDAELQRLSDSIAKDSDRRLVLQQLIAEEEIAGPRRPAGKADDPTSLPAAQQLEAARASLRQLEMRLKPEHPDIIIAKRQIKELEAKADAEALQQPVSGVPGQAPTSGAESARQTRLIQMRGELQSLDRRIATSEAEMKKAEANRAMYRGRIEAAPGTEGELATLEGDLNTINGTYQNLLKQAEAARLTASMEQRQVGEQFRVVEPARLPVRPNDPDRLQLILKGMAFGLGLGVALGALLEYRDTSLRTEDDVIVALSLPVVALVPTMTTAVERRRASRRRLVAASAFLFSVVLVTAVLVFRSRIVDLWTR